jgi:BirA family biotin operon repressor/biotin-[acetyl-CoA-carboxylase] ligase
MISSKIIEFQSLDSTSNYVAKALKEGSYPYGSVILAHYQTHGKGQRGNVWQSEREKNLTFSFAFKAESQALPHHFLYSKAVSVGLIRFLEHQKISFVSAKWPNDILVESKKISGILIESVAAEGQRYIIVGIGLNVNQEVFPDELQATSMAIELGRSLDIRQTLSELISFLNDALASLKKDGGVTVHHDYMSHLHGTESWVKLLYEGNSITGRIRDVDHSGVLMVYSKQGFPRNFRLGEVKIEY